MPKRLFDRQVSLLDYLTSGAAIFRPGASAVPPRSLRGIDPTLLHLEARFSYEKRMEKIASAFPHTLELLGDTPRLLRRFAEACPPADISRVANARQFHDFLSRRWRRTPPKPAYLRDVASCELACAEVRAHNDLPGQPDDGRAAPSGIRRHPAAVLVRCRFDVRPIFEQVATAPAPRKRVVRLAVTMPRGAERPLVCELRPVIFDVVAAMDGWIDPSALAAVPDSPRLIRELAEHGILEVRG
jgi:hypothetical protein